jgi:tRNA 2-selenouridine synthase
VLWVEDEGQFIGRVGLPPELFNRLCRAPIVELRAPFESRVRRIVATYARTAHWSELEAAVGRSRDRLGASVTATAMAELHARDLASAVRLLLPAYDEAYAHRMARQPRELLGVVETL